MVYLDLEVVPGQLAGQDYLQQIVPQQKKIDNLIVAYINILIGNAIRIKQANISKTCDEALSNIIMWDVKVITVLSQLVTFVGFIL